MSPEMVRNRDSDYKSDVWAIASIATQLVTGIIIIFYYPYFYHFMNWLIIIIYINDMMIIGFPAFLGDSDYLIFQ
jgi:serine/threonine protein kinase